MLIISSRPAVAAALASRHAIDPSAVQIASPGTEAATSTSSGLVVLDAVGMSRAFQRLADLAARSPQSRRFLLVAHPSDLAAQLARRAGAHAIISESDTSAEWDDLLQRAGNNGFLSAGSFHDAPRIASRLTSRQLEVYLLSVQGCCDDEIAHRLGTSLSTAETHRRDAQCKLGCAGHQQMVAHAIRHGIIDAGEIDLLPAVRRATRHHGKQVELV